MARYTDADCKLCRREGCKLFLKGERCLTKNVLLKEDLMFLVYMGLQERKLLNMEHN